MITMTRYILTNDAGRADIAMRYGEHHCVRHEVGIRDQVCVRYSCFWLRARWRRRRRYVTKYAGKGSCDHALRMYFPKLFDS